jgi:UDP-N-acetylmuramyl pentapeptide synthase
MRDLIVKILGLLTKLTLARYQPKIVAITGSVGKTSTKDAIAVVLGPKFSVRKSTGNYNNEIGVPLTILGEPSAGRNIFLWLIIFIKAVLKLIYTSYPQILVLEFGTDRPGDIKYLANLVGKIDIGVLTDIGISHLEFFAHPQELMKEKLSLIKSLPSNSLAVLNFDNQKIYDGKNQTRAEILGYGFNEHTNLTISDFQIIASDNSKGANFKIHHRGTVVPFYIPNALGKPIAYTAAAAVGVAMRFNIDLASASGALRNFSPPPGRLHLLSGIKNTTIIDDTYNAAPDSTFAALESLKNVALGRKLFAMGEMAELGSKTDSGHREVGAKILENQVDVVFLVGAKAKLIADELSKRKFTGKVTWFETSDQARMPVQNALIEGDTILVKGSQSSRMEKIVKEIMADPLNADKLLVRQSKNWFTQ